MSTSATRRILQLLVDTGGGTMHPVSDDHRVTFGMAWTCTVFLLPLEILHNRPAREAATLICAALELAVVYDAPNTKEFLRRLLADCEDNPGAVVSVIEVEKSPKGDAFTS